MKALACQLPSELGIPLSRFSRQELRREVVSRGISAEVSGATIWRGLSEDAIRPWTRKSWIFPRDPRFREKAGRVLDLYHGLWKGRKLGSDEFVLCADEKSGLQIRRRLQPSGPPGPGRVLRVEHEYERLGTCVRYMRAHYPKPKIRTYRRVETPPGAQTQTDWAAYPRWTWGKVPRRYMPS